MQTINVQICNVSLRKSPNIQLKQKNCVAKEGRCDAVVVITSSTSGLVSRVILVLTMVMSEQLSSRGW
jgi:hypothetical protein